MAETSSDGQHPLSRWAASAAPAVLWTAIGCPFDVIRTRLQTALPPFASALHCLEWTVRREGIQALWKGSVPMLLVTTPYSVIMFGTYQSLKPLQSSLPQNLDAKYLGGCFLAGAASGVAVTIVHNPLELWRIQVQTHLPLDGSTGGRRRTTGSVLRNLMAQPWQLGRGAHLTLAENVLGNGVFFGTHEVLQQAVWSEHGWKMEPLVGGLTGVVFQFFVYPLDLLKARLMAQDGTHVTHEARRILSEDGFSGFYRGASVAVLRAFAINAAGWPALRIVQKWFGVAP